MASSDSALRPYHAREDSQPFSYGRIQTSTSPMLRNGHADEIDIRTSSNSSAIRNEPLLKSPQLVRKTLRSPTRPSYTANGGQRSSSSSPATTNTIANTYHYKYNSTNTNNTNTNNNNNNNGDFLSSNSTPYNIYSNNNKYYTNYNNNNENSNGINKIRPSGATTPLRDDFEDLLRERREKVFNEYRSTKTMAAAAPVPPQRRYQHHLSTPALGGIGGNTNNKFKYDFEFNFDLDALENSYNNAKYLMGHNNYNNTNNNNNNNNNTTNTNTDIYSSTLYRSNAGSEWLPRQRSAATIEGYNSSSSRMREFGREQVLPPPTPLQRTYQTLDSAVPPRSGSNQYGIDSVDRAIVIDRNLSPSPIYATASKKRTETTTATSRYYNNSKNSPQNGEYRSVAPVQHQMSVTSSILSQSAASPTSASRPETPAFPVTPRTPRMAGQQPQQQQHYTSETIYQTLPSSSRSRLGSVTPSITSTVMNGAEPQEVAPHLVQCARDISRYWYKATLSRDEAISLLLHAPPGTFLIRDSTTFKGAYGLVMRVAEAPAYSQQTGSGSGRAGEELVRHFLIEPTARGVRLKGCANEPVFASLSAFVYEHSSRKLGLPCTLLLPHEDIALQSNSQVDYTPAQRQLLTQGAACDVLYLMMCETESLTGMEAVRRAVRQLLSRPTTTSTTTAKTPPPPPPIEVHFKVTHQGITLTDRTRRHFFRRHYAADIVSFCAIDPDARTWRHQGEDASNTAASTPATAAGDKVIFAFVARRSAGSKYNQCHVFCDLDGRQPASAIVAFVNRTLPTEQPTNRAL